jgi:nicotinamide-nucleotide amidase
MVLADEILSLLYKQGASLAVAESCTGGGLANEITKLSGISSVFLGSITAYANQAKEQILQIPHELILKNGAVSEEVAVSMASNCRRLFCSTWALSTTGIAGPKGDTADKPLGLVWIGIAGPDLALAKKFIFQNATRLVHREKTVDQALQMLLEALRISKS